jgi:hypothetical protein
LEGQVDREKKAFDHNFDAFMRFALTLTVADQRQLSFSHVFRTWEEKAKTDNGAGNNPIPALPTPDLTWLTTIK